MNLPPIPLHPEKYYNWTDAEKKAIEAYGQQCAQASLEQAAEQVRITQGPRSSAEDAVRSLSGEVNCSRHPEAPHGFNRVASANAGRYVCECEGWSPGDAS